MNKKNVMPILLIFFAVIAVFVASMPSAVAVYDLSQSKEPFYCTYFNLVEGVKLSTCLPLAAIAACVSLMSAGIYMVVKKPNMLSVIKLCSMASSVLAVIPVLVKDPMIMAVPNMLLPIAMIAEYVVAFYMQKNTPTPEAVQLTGKLKKR